MYCRSFSRRAPRLRATASAAMPAALGLFRRGLDMTTGYTIRLGYQSGYSMMTSDDDLWSVLKTTALCICDTPQRIAAEALRFGAPERIGEASLAELADAFRERKDLTITFADHGDDRYIHMFASGSVPYRPLKEHLRRAFIRLLIADVHQLGIEISIQVS